MFSVLSFRQKETQSALCLFRYCCVFCVLFILGFQPLGQTTHKMCLKCVFLVGVRVGVAKLVLFAFLRCPAKGLAWKQLPENCFRNFEGIWEPQDLREGKGVFEEFRVQTSKIKSRCVCVYMAVGSFAAANFAIFGIFPNFIVKNGEKEMLQLCPISLFTFLVKMTQKGPGTAIPSIFWKKDTGTAIPGLFLGSFGFQSYFCLFGKKKL